MGFSSYYTVTWSWFLFRIKETVGKYWEFKLKTKEFSHFRMKKNLEAEERTLKVLHPD